MSLSDMSDCVDWGRHVAHRDSKVTWSCWTSVPEELSGGGGKIKGQRLVARVGDQSSLLTLNPIPFKSRGESLYSVIQRSLSPQCQQWHSHWGVNRGQNVPPWQRKICQKSGKRGRKSGKIGKVLSLTPSWQIGLATQLSVSDFTITHRLLSHLKFRILHFFAGGSLPLWPVNHACQKPFKKYPKHRFYPWLFHKMTP